ncbi:hypothetical protein O181_043938 [Austropuccinia psidii MF-1]|uniref:Uncharacterized protein n=1 Tax=Austropuccinia psidii MF-1 TaxID=1389203 RepID=A0A9Q3DP53_9BASI|nr:hypothetical protein [Austropuccinia psidii MF-1]
MVKRRGEFCGRGRVWWCQRFSPSCGESQGTGGPTLAQFNQPVSHQSEPYLLAIMQKMTQIMANLQAASSSEASRNQPSRLHLLRHQNALMGLNPSK